MKFLLSIVIALLICFPAYGQYFVIFELDLDPNTPGVQNDAVLEVGDTLIVDVIFTVEAAPLPLQLVSADFVFDSSGLSVGPTPFNDGMDEFEVSFPENWSSFSSLIEDVTAFSSLIQLEQSDFGLTGSFRLSGVNFFGGPSEMIPEGFSEVVASFALEADGLLSPSGTNLRFNSAIADGVIPFGTVDPLPSEFVDFRDATVTILPGPVSVPPTSLNIIRGIQANGDVNSLANSDNIDLSIQRNPQFLTALTDFEVTATSPTLFPVELSFTLEASVFSRRTITQTILLFDYQAGVFEEVDVRNAQRFSDSTVTIEATGDLSRFVDQVTGEIKAKIQHQSANRRTVFSSNIDQVNWVIND